MFANTNMMKNGFPVELVNTYKAINSDCKKYAPERIMADSARFFAAVDQLEEEADVLEREILARLAEARAQLKLCKSKRAEIEKQMGQMKTLGKGLEKHLAAAFKALKDGDTRKLSGIIKRAGKDGPAYLKAVKTASDTASIASKHAENAHENLKQTKKAANVAKITPLAIQLGI